MSRFSQAQKSHLYSEFEVIWGCFSVCSYAKVHIPIIASVSEHQPTTWVSFFFDLHVLVCTFPAGLWFCIRNISDERVFGTAVFLQVQGWVSLCLTWVSLPPSSGAVCRQRGVFRRCDGPSHADSDAGGVRAVGRGFLQRVWALSERRSSGWGRQEELWESVWEGSHNNKPAGI